MQQVCLEASRQLRGIVHADDALVGRGGLTSYFESRQLSLRIHVFLADLHDVDTSGKGRLEEALKIALLLRASCTGRAGKAEPCLQALSAVTRPRYSFACGDRLVIMSADDEASLTITPGLIGASELRLSAFPLGANQLHKSTAGPHPPTHQPTTRQGVDVYRCQRLTIQQIQEGIPAGFATSPSSAESARRVGSETPRTGEQHEKESCHAPFRLARVSDAIGVTNRVRNRGTLRCIVGDCSAVAERGRLKPEI